MAKWKCEICGNEFENFHAQGFDSKIYCPLCYFKRKNQELKEKLDKYENPEDMTLMMMWCTEQVKDENKKLKKKYENAVTDYETTMFEKEQLKKQVEYEKKRASYWYNVTLSNAHIIQKNKNQQKEFIKNLEDEIYSIEPKGTGIIYNCEYDSEEDYVMAMQEQSRLNTLKEILQKYKSIIGDKDETKSIFYITY